MKRGTRSGANGGGVRSKKKGKSLVVVVADHQQKEKEDEVGHEYETVDQVVDGSRDGEAVVVKEEKEKEKVVVGSETVEEWGGLWSGVVDEQMSTWGTFGFPILDMGTHEAYSNRFLYHDVLDDYDIWDLKGIQEIPNP